MSRISMVQGLPAPIVGAMAENASLFWSYTEIQNAIRWTTGTPLTQQLSLGQLACAGAGAGAITSFVLCVLLIQSLLLCVLTAVEHAERPLNSSSARCKCRCS